jgi:hypothetical protein
MDLIKPPNEYVVIHNDLSVNTISHSPHVNPDIPTIMDIQTPTLCSNERKVHEQKEVKRGYRSTLTTPDGKPLFNCLLQHNPEPICSKPKILSESEIQVINEKAKLMKERIMPR